MSEAGAVILNPVRGKARIEVLDILRGIAILGIFVMNLPFMAGPTESMLRNIRLGGWQPIDQVAWSAIFIFWEGTQRGILEFLFGAALMVLSARAMKPDGPVAVADLYIRRSLWLLLFGLFDLFGLLWPGDILHIYALAALFLFPFRHLKPRWLIPLGLIFSTYYGVTASFQYVDRVQLSARVETARQHQAQNKILTGEDKKALADWQKKLDRLKIDKETKQRIDAENKARSGSYAGYATWLWGAFMMLWGKGSTFIAVGEAFSAMLIGIALWKLGIIQGQRSTRFYALTALIAYGFGLTARAIGVSEIMTFQPIPKTIWITSEYARLAVSLGHVAMVNLLVRFRPSHAVLKPFVAAGQVAFSLYFLEQIIGINILFSPVALGLRGVFGYATLWAWATGIGLVLLLVANVWTRYFVSGPMEWAWRSLAYWRIQPFRRERNVEYDATLPGPLPA